jgi:hypothetical protein
VGQVFSPGLLHAAIAGADTHCCDAGGACVGGEGEDRPVWVPIWQWGCEAGERRIAIWDAGGRRFAAEAMDLDDRAQGTKEISGGRGGVRF